VPINLGKKRKEDGALNGGGATGALGPISLGRVLVLVIESHIGHEGASGGTKSHRMVLLFKRKTNKHKKKGKAYWKRGKRRGQEGSSPESGTFRGAG